MLAAHAERRKVSRAFKSDAATAERHSHGISADLFAGRLADATAVDLPAALAQAILSNLTILVFKRRSGYGNCFPRAGSKPAPTRWQSGSVARTEPVDGQR